jgi:hypothetical protein
MVVGFDIISDLELSYKNKLDWEGKPTSLFCIVAGNITNDFKVLEETLEHLSAQYHGVFFIDGSREIGSLVLQASKIDQIAKIASKIKNVVYLHNNVVIVDGIALVAVNGWYGNYTPIDSDDEIRLVYHSHGDQDYLHTTIEKLQLHVDVKKIVIVSSCVPCADLFYGEEPNLPDYVGLNAALINDTENKIVTWIYGNSNKMVDTNINGINYVNNACFSNNPYWPKRIEIEI